MIVSRADRIVLFICISCLVLIQKSYTQALPSILPYPLEEVYEYDPLNQRFIKRQTLAEQTSGYPLYLSFTEFYEALRRQTLKTNFQQKIAALSKTNDSISGVRKNVLPTYYVNSDFFESVFGGNTITVATSGGFNFDAGSLIQRTENPALAIRNQRSTLLDVDQQFDFNLNAQVGDRLSISAAIDSRSTFNFDNLFKLTYTPNEDDWLRNLEFGNVSLPLRSSLLSGAQNVFGVRSDFQFGRTKVSAVYGEQRSQRSSVRSENGNVINRFELSALDY